MRNNKAILFFLVNAIIPILIGLILYLFIKPDSYVSQLINKIVSVPSVSLQYNNVLIYFIRFYLCDMLWAYSLTFTMYLILVNDFGGMILCFLIAGVFSIFIELLQYFGIVSGTFDFFDVIAEMISIVLALGIIKIFYWRKENEKPN